MSEDSGDKSQKTEQPTEHKLQQALEKGQIAVSKEVSHWIVIFTIACLIAWILPNSFSKLSQFLASIIENSDWFPNNKREWDLFVQKIYIHILKFCAVPFIMLSIACIIGSGIQTRFKITSSNLKFDFGKLSITKGLKRLLGVKALVEFLKNLFKLTLLASIAIMAFWPERNHITRYAELPFYGFLSILEQLSSKFFVWILSFLALLALLDYMYQKFMWLQNLKMTPQEIKEEHKQMEGDPHIKGRLRQMRYERSKRRVMAEVPNATVLITNPTHFAIALKYKFGEMNAPIVVAKGVDSLALKMREVAKSHDVPLIENPPLAQALYREVKEGKEIPVEYYDAVAQIIRYIINQKNK